jgi:alpha-1,2-mannosyltransferase
VQAGRSGHKRLVAVYCASAVICAVVTAATSAAFVDLHVYRTGASAVLHGYWLYGVRFWDLPFTYPPFAAIALTPFAVVPWWLAVALMLAANIVATPVMFYLALRLRPVSGWLSRQDAARLAIGAAVVAIWLEPAFTTFAFGQVNILLTVLVLADLVIPDDRWYKGIATGIAAGIKLIPLIFIVYLAVTRRLRAATVAAGVFAATIAVGYAVTPAASQYFYGDLNFIRSSRIGRLSNDWNQSLLGAVARDVGREPGSLWLIPVFLVGVAGVALAARASRRGDDATGYSLCAITALLVTPISWTHHWVLALPALLLAALRAWRRRTEDPRRAKAWLIAIGALALIGWSSIARFEPRMAPARELHLSPLWLAASQVYVAAGLVVLALAGLGYLRERLQARRPSPPGPTSRPAALRPGRHLVGHTARAAPAHSQTPTEPTGGRS